MNPSPRKTLITVGNCQAHYVAEVFKHDPAIATHYRVLHLSTIPGTALGEVGPAELAMCDVLLEQVSPVPFPNREHLHPHAHILKFQTAALYFLYPFYSRINPYNVRRPPAIPWGLYNYGDQVIIDMVDKRMPADEILDTYLNHYERYAVDLDRLYRLEEARLRALDATCDVPITSFLLEHFRTTRLFFTVLHPTPAVFWYLCGELAKAAAAFDPVFLAADSAATLHRLLQTHPRGPLHSQIIPVHPKVVEHFGLTWVDPHQQFEVGPAFASYQAYFAGMINEYASVKAARERGELVG